MKMTDHIKIVKASPKDLLTVKNMLKEIDFEFHSLEHVFVAKADEKIVGMGRAEFFRNKKLATIAGVYVLPTMREKKIGLEIVNSIIKEFSQVSTWYLAGHSWIEKYYENIGFKKIKEIIPELKRNFDNQIFMTHKT